MFSFFATILSVTWLLNHLTEILIFCAALVALIIYIAVRNRKRRAAYLALPIIYIGNRETRTYHNTYCHTLKNASKANLVYFRTKDEVSRSGYKPCGTCIKY